MNHSRDRAGMATAAMVLGILTAVFAFIPIIGVIAFILGPLAIIFGLLARKSSKRGQAIAGLATGGAGLAISILWLAIFAAAVGSTADDLEKLSDQTDAYFSCVWEAQNTDSVEDCDAFLK